MGDYITSAKLISLGSLGCNNSGNPTQSPSVLGYSGRRLVPAQTQTTDLRLYFIDRNQPDTSFAVGDQQDCFNNTVQITKSQKPKAKI